MAEVNVCIGTSCHLNGAYNVVQTFQQLMEEHSVHDKVELKAYFCMKQCQNKGVSVTIDGEGHRVEPENARSFFQDQILKKVK